MNAKKLVALLLALVLCVGTLAACDTNKPAETTAPTTKPAGTTAPTGTTAPATMPTEAEKVDAEQTNLDIYPLDFDGTLTAVTTKSNAAEAHNYLLWEELTGIDIDWQVMSNEQVPMLFVGDAAKNMPDIFFSPGGVTVAQMKDYGAEGLLINFLDEEILAKMPNLKAAYEMYPALFDGVKTADGAAYTLPYYCFTLTMQAQTCYIRTDMTKEAGIEELPTTIEGFLEMCETLKTYYKDVEGYVPMVTNGGAGIKFTGAYSQFFFPAFGELLTTNYGITPDNTKVYAGFASEQYKLLMKFFHECWEKGYIDPNAYATESNTDKAKMIDRKTTMNPFATYLTPANFASGELDFQVLPPLSSEYGTAKWLEPNHYRSTNYAISASTKYLDEACAFLDACYAQQDNPLKVDGDVSAWGVSLWLGECGEDFELHADENYYVLTPDPAKYDSGSAFLSSAGHGSSLFLYWPYMEKSGTGLMKKAEGYLASMDYAIEALDISLLILNEDELMDYNDYATPISNKIAEYTAAFITGQKDIDAEWDTYIEELNNEGLQTVLDNYQTALDRYNAG